MDKLTWTHNGVQATNDGVGGVRSLTVSDIGVVFQPIVDVRNGRTFAHEALVRCRRPEYAAPPKLFECAVEENATGRLGRLIRDVAFSTCGDIPLFVNLHPEELSSRWLVRPDDPMCLHGPQVFLEITETAAFTHFDLCRSVISELCRRTGALLVVDDFGAGYSNLQRLVDLEPAIVKLDLALTRDVHRLPRMQAVVRHIVNLCTELGAPVVAEGIEVVDELSCVRDLGVTYAQGYLLARPAAPPPKPYWPFANASVVARVAHGGGVGAPPTHKTAAPPTHETAAATAVAAPSPPVPTPSPAAPRVGPPPPPRRPPPKPSKRPSKKPSRRPSR